MKLKDIDKTRYRKHLNIVIVACIAVLAAGSLATSQLLILLFPDPDGSHFHWNLLGVVLTGLIIGLILNHIKQHPFMTEVTYVWELKQTLNRITRKMTRLKRAAETGNITAMVIMQFNYAGSRLLWQLDDNTIVMDELAIEQAKLDSLAARYSVNVNIDDFDIKALAQF